MNTMADVIRVGEAVPVIVIEQFTLGVVTLKPTTKSKAVATSMTTGTRMWCHVRSTNASGTGAWSDVATKIVP